MKIGFSPALNGLFRIFARTKAMLFIAVLLTAMLLILGLFAPVQSASVQAQAVLSPVRTPDAMEGLALNNSASANMPHNPVNPDAPLKQCTDITELTVPVLQAPANNSQLDTLLPIFMWEIDQAMVSENMYARLEVAADSQFNNVIQTMFVWHAFETSFSGQLTSNLNPNTVYYWRARLRCQAGQFQNGPLSPVYSFTTGSDGVLLPAPVLLTPLNGSIVATGTVVLAWQPVEGAIEYKVSWDAGLSGSGRVITETQLAISAPALGVDYAWRVSARNDYAFGALSDSWVFSTTAAPKPTPIPSNVVYEMQQGTYLGGHDWEGNPTIGTDSKGKLYVAGRTSSNDFPTTAGALHKTLNGDSDGFLSALNSQLEFSTLIGGSEWDGAGVAISDQGGIFVVGNTGSSDLFTQTSSIDATPNGGSDIFVAKYHRVGNSMVLDWGTYWGGSGDEHVSSFYLDAQGDVYVTGTTRSPTFPTTDNAFDRTYDGGFYDLFVVKFAGDGTRVIYSSLLGGDDWEDVFDIVADGSGRAYVTGFTQSQNFPTTANAYAEQCSATNFCSDVFVTSFNPDGSSLHFSTYINGRSNEVGRALALAANGNVFVGGQTSSTDFPTTPGSFEEEYSCPFGPCKADLEGFLLELSADGSTLLKSTYMGGQSHFDQINALAIDPLTASIYAVGSTESDDFPMTTHALQKDNAGNQDGLFLSMSMDLSTLNYSTYLGGAQEDDLTDITIGPNGSIYLAGVTKSPDFPFISAGYDSSSNGEQDIIVLEVQRKPSTYIYLPVITKQ